MTNKGTSQAVLGVKGTTPTPPSHHLDPSSSVWVHRGHGQRWPLSLPPSTEWNSLWSFYGESAFRLLGLDVPLIKWRHPLSKVSVRVVYEWEERILLHCHSIGRWLRHTSSYFPYSCASNGQVDECCPGLLFCQARKYHFETRALGHILESQQLFGFHRSIGWVFTGGVEKCQWNHWVTINFFQPFLARVSIVGRTVSFPFSHTSVEISSWENTRTFWVFLVSVSHLLISLVWAGQSVQVFIGTKNKASLGFHTLHPSLSNRFHLILLFSPNEERMKKKNWPWHEGSLFGPIHFHILWNPTASHCKWSI